MKVKVSSLKHHPKNKEIYNLSSIEELMDSISEVGLLQSLIIDQHHQIISGNRRFESIKRLGWEEVEVEVKGNGNTPRRYLERKSKTVDFLITCLPS